MYPGDLKSTYGYIEEQRDGAVEGLKRLLSQPSVSTLGTGIRETAAMVKEIMESAGLRTRIIETSGHPFVYGEAMVDPRKRTVLFYGHYDVQPPDPLDAWTSPPFQPTIRDGRVYARGAGDNKGQLYAQLMGIRTLTREGRELPVNVKFIAEGEEENGSPHLEQVFRENKGMLRADLAITSDGPLHQSGRPLLVFGVRGNLYVELTAKGAGRDLHSGNWGGPVPNPAWRLVDLLRTMKDATTGRALVEGFYAAARPASAEDAKAIESIPFDRELVARELSLPVAEVPEAKEFYTRLMTEPTMNICGMQSGYTGRGMKTVIPSRATAKIDMRLVPDQDPDDVLEKMKRHVAEHAAGVEITKLGSMRPSRTPLSNQFTKTVTDAVRDATQEEPIVYPSLGASLPDHVFTHILGIPSFIVPYANHDESNHAPNENIRVENFVRGMKCCASILVHLARG